MPRSCAARSRMAGFADSTRPLRAPSPACAPSSRRRRSARCRRSRCACCPCPGPSGFCSRSSQSDRVRYVGEPIAVVLADSAALAEDGVGAIALDIEELPPVADRRASGRHDILLFEESGTNLAMTFTAVLGDADAAFREAAYVRRECFQVQRYTALPMEPRGVLAEWDAAQAADDRARRRQGAVLQSRYSWPQCSGSPRRVSI